MMRNLVPNCPARNLKTLQATLLVSIAHEDANDDGYAWSTLNGVVPLDRGDSFFLDHATINASPPVVVYHHDLGAYCDG